jgi:Capsular polysaccharide biosynthesis protein
MIDIHSHILPGVDDGSDSMETSLEMLSMAAESGVKVIFATPHANSPGEFENYSSDRLRFALMELRQAAADEGIPLKICRGMELFATDDLPELLRDGIVWTMNGTKYFLTEFAFDEDPDFCFETIERSRNYGFRPIIAHPERYFFIQEDPQIAYELCMAGSALQLNKGSLLGRFGPDVQETAELLIEHRLAACVASDAHGVESRTTDMYEVAELINRRWGSRLTRLLLRENPAKIIAGERLLGYEPIPFED